MEKRQKNYISQNGIGQEMGKKKKKKIKYLKPETAQWANEKKTEWWINDKCGHCGAILNFQYDADERILYPSYWRLYEGGRQPYCDAYHSFYHHQENYKLNDL